MYFENMRKNLKSLIELSIFTLVIFEIPCVFVQQYVNFSLKLKLETDVLNLPKSHLASYFNKFPLIKHSCLRDNDYKCKYREYLNSIRQDQNQSKVCWGYEETCDTQFKLYEPECSSNSHEAQTVESKKQDFFRQLDFGYIKQQVKEMFTLCKSNSSSNSFLECSNNLRYCHGQNIFLNLTHLKSASPFRYDMNVLKQGGIGGQCVLNKKRLLTELDHMNVLQSWAPELRYFEEMNESIENNENLCDVIVEKPTYLMKVDAYTNMYHHFCDFFNLYLSMHTSRDPLAFSTDAHILIWETFTYKSQFSETFSAFTDYPIWDLKTFQGKTICFKKLVLPLLPRMIFGLYYNSPVVEGCKSSGLFKAFSEFILHRLNIIGNDQVPVSHSYIPKIRITFLSRRTKFRRVLNENELLTMLSKNDSYLVRTEIFDYNISFRKQLEIISNTDILIGMHGAGLTHLLFLPKWSSVFELYNCGDPNCYKNLADLRGLNYITWENESKIISETEDTTYNAKFNNYRFDGNEFLRLVGKSAESVLKQFSYKKFIKKLLLMRQKHQEL